MRVLITGASGLIGGALCRALLDRGDEVVGLTRDPERAGEREARVEWHAWEATAERPPEAALAGCDAVVNLQGAPIAQRWTARAKEAIRESRVTGTRNLVTAIAAMDTRPRALVSGSAVGYYGDRGPAILDEEAGPGEDFAAGVCAAWEAEAWRASELGLRVASSRTGIVLGPGSEALARMLPPFKLGLGGPIAGGGQYMSWVHLDDIVGLLLWMLDGDVAGPVNSTAPEPVTNRDFSKALGRAIGRPAVMPVPGLALRVLFGEMGQSLTASQRAVPRRALDGGYTFRWTDVETALRDSV